MAGINRAIANRGFILDSVNESFDFRKRTAETKPCIFISHLSTNKDIAIAIGDYIKNSADIDIYLDIYDAELQSAAQEGNPHKITKSIETGITNSSHVMCLVTNNTHKSWWVPYELGFAKKSNKQLSSLQLKDVYYIPDYLQISKIIKGTASLNAYLLELAINYNSDTIYNKAHPKIIPETTINHPLDSCLMWNI